MSYWLISTLKYLYLVSYDIKRDFCDSKIYNLVLSEQYPWNNDTKQFSEKYL